MMLFSLLLTSVIGPMSVAASMPYLRAEDLPITSQHWQSLSQKVEFLPADEVFKGNLRKPAETLQRSRFLEESVVVASEDEESMVYNEYDPYSVQPFVEGIGEYDEYQQAWRMLGFMIDCNGYYYNDDDNSGGSNDEDVTEDGCRRYVLWAAYVDLEYEGSGIAEYQYWDRFENKWDKNACKYAEDNSRCAKMDCHLENTHWSLLGVFKHQNYDDWMEQLFKHEGMCVWTEEEYAFMKNTRESWPQGCTISGKQTADGEDLYYNLKPMKGGRISVGLYVDNRCVVDYSAESSEIEDLLGNFLMNNGDSHDSGDNNYDFSGETLEESMERWNSAFDVWRTCHPCVAYDLENTSGNMYTGDDYQQNDDQANRKLGGEYSAQGDVFECYDDAGYTNVNQCMKFSAKTVMNTATFRDLGLGQAQGTLVESPLSGFLDSRGIYRREWAANCLTYIFFAVSTLCLCYASVHLYRAKRDAAIVCDADAKEALIGQNDNNEYDDH